MTPKKIQGKNVLDFVLAFIGSLIVINVVFFIFGFVYTINDLRTGFDHANTPSWITEPVNTKNELVFITISLLIASYLAFYIKNKDD